MTPDEVARLVELRGQPEFVAGLRSADSDFQSTAFESAVAEVLRCESGLVDAWSVWSVDQRWTPSAWFEGALSGWLTSDGAVVHERLNEDEAAAASNFIRRLAEWLARRSVLYADSSEK